jgi:hypothetical protein
VEDLGSTKEILNEQTAEVDEKIAEVTTEAVDEMKKEGEINEIKISLDVIEKVKGFKSIKECNSSEEYKAYYEMKKVEIDEIDKKVLQKRKEILDTILNNPEHHLGLKLYIQNKLDNNTEKGVPYSKVFSVEDVMKQFKEGNNVFKFDTDDYSRHGIYFESYLHDVNEKYYQKEENKNKHIFQKTLDDLNEEDFFIRRNTVFLEEEQELIFKNEDIKEELIDCILFEVVDKAISDPFFQENGRSKFVSGLLQDNKFKVHKVLLNKLRNECNSEKYSYVSNYSKHNIRDHDLLSLAIEKGFVSPEEIKSGILETINQMQEKVTKKEWSEDEVINGLGSIIRHSGLTDEYKNFAKNTILNKFNFASEQRKKDFENSF